MLKKKFQPAINGFLFGLQHRSIRVQFVLGLLAVLAGLLLKLTYHEWLAVIVCIGMVVLTEYLNTAIEFVCNYLTEKRDEKIRIIKDVSAGGVLVASLTSLITAVVILTHHILEVL